MTTINQPVYRIGELAAATQLTPDALRYYERLGLLPKPPRSPGGFRMFGPRLEGVADADEDLEGGLITVTFESGARPEPDALQEVVRRVDFTPGDIRFWVHGTIEDSGAPDRPALTLVSSGSGQRFAIQWPAEVQGRAAVDALGEVSGAVTVWGTVERAEGRPDIILRVEGHEAAAHP